MDNIDIEKMPYRKGANALVINNDNEILLVQKVSYKENEWDIPGGGIEDGENPETAVLRELQEELGSTNFELKGQSKYINKFEWPMEVIMRGHEKRNKWYRGQQKFQFLVMFKGNETDIKFQESEIRIIKWVYPKELEQYLIFPNQFENMLKVLNEFSLI